MASFAYIGIELVIITAGEARFPTRDLPKASRRMYIYALVFYIFGMLFVSLCVPYDHPRLLHRGMDVYGKPEKGGSRQSTPGYIIAIQEAGIRFLPGFVNAAFLFCAATAGMTALYASSRTLYAITRDSSIKPLRVFGKTDSRGVPYWAVLASWSIALFGFLQVSGGDHNAKNIAPKVALLLFLLLY
jgi:yeast amino acid transporter